MKNSTIAKILLICGALFPLFKFFTLIIVEIFLALSIICVFAYIILSFLDTFLFNYDYSMIKKEHNIFYQIGRFLKWLDSKPRIIKPSKKNWRSPDNWDSEV